MEVLLDSSFIISCARDRIDFLGQLAEQGFTVKVPREVLQELKDVRMQSKTSHEDRVAIDVALTMLSSKKVKKMSFGKRGVDEGLISRGQDGYYIATLDREIKHKVPKRIVIFKSKGTVGVE